MCTEGLTTVGKAYIYIINKKAKKNQRPYCAPVFSDEDMPLSSDFSVNSIELIVPELCAIKGIADAIKHFC